MDYAIVLYFDEASENKIQTIINKLAENGINHYMIDSKIPPHITIGAFKSNDFSILIDAINRCIHKFSYGQVYWASIGIFNPYVGLAEKLSFLVFHPIFVAFMRLPLWQPFLSAFLSSNLLFFAFFEEFLKKGNKEHALRALSSLL